jgi:hypothetical protein
MAEIHSAFVSQVAPMVFADALDSFSDVIGAEVVAGKSRLRVSGPIGTGFADARYFAGTLRTGSALIPSVKVEIVVSPWSAGRTEIGVRPLSSLGHLDSLRSNRFYRAAREVLAALLDRIGSDATVEETPELVLAA